MAAERELIKRAQRGDRQALEQLLKDNYSVLKGYLMRLTLNAPLADDLTQEVMVRAIINIKSFQPRAKFSTWLITIGSNLYRDKLRKDSRLVPIKDHMVDDGSETMDDLLDDRIQIKQLKEIMQKLPYEKRAVVVLKHYHGYKYEEIAKILDCPVGTVRSRLHNSIDFIRREMERRKWL